MSITPSTLSGASLDELLNELYSRTKWVAIVYATEDNEVGVVCEGANGIEILGGITMLMQTHTAAVATAIFGKNSHVRDS